MILNTLPNDDILEKLFVRVLSVRMVIRKSLMLGIIVECRKNDTQESRIKSLTFMPLFLYT